MLLRTFSWLLLASPSACSLIVDVGGLARSDADVSEGRDAEVGVDGDVPADADVGTDGDADADAGDAGEDAGPGAPVRWFSTTGGVSVNSSYRLEGTLGGPAGAGISENAEYWLESGGVRLVRGR